MPLEFALRRRIDLERPAPRRRLGWLRVPPLALPVGAYWLALAGIFYALRPATASSSASSSGWFGNELARSARALGAAFDSDEAAPSHPPASTPGATRSSPPATASPTLAPVPSPSATPSPIPDASGLAVLTPPAVATDAPGSFERLPRQDATATHSASERRTDLSDARIANRRPELRPELRSDVGVVPRTTLRADDRDDAEAPRALTSSASSVEKSRASPGEPTEFAPSEELPRETKRAAALPSCEAAAASANETMEIGARRGAPDITRDAFARVLENGAYLAACAIPPNAALDICAAVQDGKVVGVSVSTAPRNAATNACVRRAVSALRFPRSTRLDVTRTHFAPMP